MGLKDREEVLTSEGEGDGEVIVPVDTMTGP
jgi:hypothetical protein